MWQVVNGLDNAGLNKWQNVVLRQNSTNLSFFGIFCAQFVAFSRGKVDRERLRVLITGNNLRERACVYEYGLVVNSWHDT